MAFADVENLLKESMGLDAASIGAAAIERAVMERALACEVTDPRAYWTRVCASPTELQALIEAVVVPETWFFRDRQAFSTLARLAQEASLAADPDGVLRLLSLPSSTGEEPYSMAMALFDAGMSADRFVIDAVDISAQAVVRARSAIYGKNSFRGHELGFRARYFDATATGYRLSDRVRRQVHFRRANLFAHNGLTGSTSYDAIFCRNLLIYFDRATQDRAIQAIDRRLTPNGVLFVAPSETGVLLRHGFVTLKAPFAFAFRKAAKIARERTSRVSPASQSRVVSQPPPPLAPAPTAEGRPEPASTACPVPQSTTDAVVEVGVTLDEAAELANRGHFEEAFGRCEQHLRHSGPSAEAFHLMGLVRDASGDPVEAERYYRKALYLDPNHRDVLIHLALLLEKAGKTSTAQVLRQRANRLTQRSGPHDAPAR